MWSDFFKAGGWGMYPVTIFGFFLVVVTVLYALRSRPHHARLAWLLGACTHMAGWLGTATGVCTTGLYLQQVAPAKQVEIFALGLQESLHNLVLALIFTLIASVIAIGGVLREAAVKAA
ncbi:MAG TPA: hypothetical protein VGH28_17140 [Polyangiaceae bacterium]|jgi:hypothetical protein